MEHTLEPINSPVFPVEKDLEIPASAQPLGQTTSIQVFVELAEPVVFLQGFEQHQWDERPPGLLRGSLIIRVLKPSKVKSINLKFRGVSKTEWPEGIPPKKQEFIEAVDIVNHTWPFFQSENSHVPNSNSTDPDDLLKGSNASIYRPLKKKSNSVSSINLNSASLTQGMSKPSSSNLLPIGNILRRAASPEPHQRTRGSGSALSDLVTGTLSDASDSASVFSRASSGTEPFIFQPGDYIYSFEQPITLSCPETIQASFGSVTYYLQVTIERSGAFKSNIHVRCPIQIVRTPSDSSVEETEPIAISRDWEDQLHYDIVIASKDIVLDAFLPIAFRVTPLDKVTLHRIRIYLTETLEYYCKNKKVHRLEPTKKFLLAEHKAPPIDDLPDSANLSKAKNLGNLLVDSKSGDLVSKEFEYQVFIPEKLSMHQRVHPDTSYQNIKSNHWIKICLRLSRIIDGKRKHYEISIDSPIHVLHKLCSHANTLLPSYDTHALIPGADYSKFGNKSVNLYHDSNLYFPKDIINSPVMSPEVHAMDERIGFSSRTHAPNQSQLHHGSSHRRSDDQKTNLDDAILNSPELKSNIYHPENLQPELASPQAIPLSPISSPIARPIHLIRTPSFEPPPFDADCSPPPMKSGLVISGAPIHPPTYDDVLSADGIRFNGVKPGFTITDVDGSSKVSAASTRRDSSARFVESSEDIASSFSFGGSVPGSPDLPGAIIKPHQGHLKSLTLAAGMNRQDSINDNLPSTVKNFNSAYSDLNDVLGYPEGTECSPISPPKSRTSSVAASPRSSVDTVRGYPSNVKTAGNMEPLLHTKTNRTMDTFLQSNDSIGQFNDLPTEASVDITALYDRNSNAWHPLQNELSTSPIPGRDLGFSLANGNTVLEDFKRAFRVPVKSESPENEGFLRTGSTTNTSKGPSSSNSQSSDEGRLDSQVKETLKQKEHTKERRLEEGIAE
ncbi:LAMI_0H14224g1_1 [Lachancea mirantina]|uniref:LAMI_0H14224g1_1 n=1 Tax=Lachancea mirantina TaxID=1230905 RepID=A0A1G4KIB4_9SACH|nr:LAMI_0H14224g1_1 [Lachancea mirantina]